MDAVLKIGGSLSKDIVSLKNLCKEIGDLANKHQIIVVPGGGEFADAVRFLDSNYNFSDSVAHKIAILAMDQFGFFLSELIPKSYVTYTFNEKRRGLLPIFLPSQFLFQNDLLEHSWDVTSDSIAAFIADRLKVKKLILVKDVDGIFLKDPKQESNSKFIEELSTIELMHWKNETCVDKNLYKILLESNLDCYIVNGKHPKRIELVLEEKNSIFTHLVE